MHSSAPVQFPRACRVTLIYQFFFSSAVQLPLKSVSQLVVFKDKKYSRSSSLGLKVKHKPLVRNQISCDEGVNKFVMTDYQLYGTIFNISFVF